MSDTNYGLANFSADTLQGQTQSLAAYAGKVLLIVNTASQCGFTPQYAGLEALYQIYKDRGLIILGFPCNQFGAQEPGSAEEIGAPVAMLSTSPDRLDTILVRDPFQD